MVFEPTRSKSSASLDAAATERTKILYLGGAHDALLNLQERLGEDVELVPLNSSLKALALMGRGDYAGVFVDADHFTEATDVGRLLFGDIVVCQSRATLADVRAAEQREGPPARRIEVIPPPVPRMQARSPDAISRLRQRLEIPFGRAEA